MKEATEELAELMDLGGVKFGKVPKGSSAQPVRVALAIRHAAASDLLQRLAVGGTMVVSQAVAWEIKLAANKKSGLKVSMRKIDQATARITRVS